MNEKRLPKLMVILKGEKVYKVPVRSEIELDHLKDFNTLRRILTPLVQLYHGVFENEKKKGGLMYKEPSLEPMGSSIIKEALYLLTPQLP